MNTVEADQVIKEYLAQQERTEQLKRLHLKKNLQTFFQQKNCEKSYCHEG